MEKALPAIPAKRYFTIGEVSELCGVKPYVLRYWEQEFTQLKPMKRRGNRRYYQHHEVLLVRRIRDLLYDQGFTISGARNRLADASAAGARAAGAEGRSQAAAKPTAASAAPGRPLQPALAERPDPDPQCGSPPVAARASAGDAAGSGQGSAVPAEPLDPVSLRAELLSIRDLLQTGDDAGPRDRGPAAQR
jgi:DNA-binding transcriptional MerR regulator